MMVANIPESTRQNNMEWWDAFWLGLTQGITEFIPVSSSGHLEIMQTILGGRSDVFHFFLEFINFGTLLVLLIYYRKRIRQIIQDVFVKHDFKLLVNIVITCIPAVILGLLLNDLIDGSPFFSSLTTIAIMMALIGVVMIIIDKIPHMKKVKDETKLDKKRALYIGLAQAVALIPGTSRSGSTIIAGRLVGMNNKSAADYSFLVSIPIMCGVILKSLLSEESRIYIAQNAPMLLLSNIVAFIAGSLEIKWALNFLKRDDALKYFGWYRVILATIIIIFQLLK